MISKKRQHYADPNECCIIILRDQGSGTEYRWDGKSHTVEVWTRVLHTINPSHAEEHNIGHWTCEEDHIVRSPAKMLQRMTKHLRARITAMKEGAGQ